MNPVEPSRRSGPDSRIPIRSHLERDCRRNHPDLAIRLAGRRRTQRRETRSARHEIAPTRARPGASAPAARVSEPSSKRQGKDRGRSWRERAFGPLAIALLLSLCLQLESARADSDGAWGIELQSATDTHTALALDTAVHAEVTGLMARVQVAQLFRNDGADWAEGVYRFPLPPGAAVDQLHVEVGDRVLVGEIHERAEASRLYAQARDEGRAAGLVAQERANQFSTRLANIGPGEEIRVMIGFLLNLDFDDGRFRLRLPMTFTPRFGAEAQAGTGHAAASPTLVGVDLREDHQLALSVDLLTDIDVAAIESRYHDVRVEPVSGGYRVTLAGGGHRSDRDFELTWQPALGVAPISSLATWVDGGSVYAQLMVLPPLESALAAQPREVIFVIDTSGSMRGDSLRQAKAALRRGLDGLGPEDRFNLIEFATFHHALFDASAPAARDELERARRWIGKLQADGGTVMAPALLRALSAPPQPGLLRQVVFVTDGSVGNESELLTLIVDEIGRARLFTVSIGSSPNLWFMRKAAEMGRGSHTAIAGPADVEERMSLLLERIRQPALSNICVDWGIDAESYPAVVPDLYAGQPLWVTARLPALPERVELCGRLNGSDWWQEVIPSPEAGAPALATLWAQRKIEALQDGLMFGADPQATRALATRVALDHALLSPWTSLVAVDRSPARPDQEPLAEGEIPGLLPAGSAFQGAGYPPTATGWRMQLLLSLLVLAISGGLFINPFFRLPEVVLRRGAALLRGADPA